MLLIRALFVFVASEALPSYAKRLSSQEEDAENAYSPSGAIHGFSSKPEHQATFTWFSSLGDEDACFNSGRCSRLVVDAGEDAVTSCGDKVVVRFRSCAIRHGSDWLPQRFAYGSDVVSNYYTFKQSPDESWQVIGGEQRYIKHVHVVKATVRELHGAHRAKDDRHPPIDDADLREKNTNSFATWSNQTLGSFKASSLSALLNHSTYETYAGDGQEIRIVVDIESGTPTCPVLGPTGNQVYTSADHFKLMQLGVGEAACKVMQEKQAVAPNGAEFYCLDRTAQPLRGWVIAVDLHLAKPLVRDPAWEPNGGLASKTLFKDSNARPAIKRRKRHKCRYIAYAPERYLDLLKGLKKKKAEAEKLKVLLNANFFLFLDVRENPCATPTGPVVADGHIVQSWNGTLNDLEFWSKQNRPMARFQITHSLVMAKGEGAFILESDQFDSWFATLDADVQKNISVVTGHAVLEGGLPIGSPAGVEHNEKVQQWWDREIARTVIGLQYQGKCAAWLRTDKMCAQMILILQLERKSSGEVHFTHFEGEAEYFGDRVDSKGASMNNVQHLLQYLMVDAAVNLDSSGSSSLWTSIGNLAEKRSQPSDKMSVEQDGVKREAYQFRPSPTVLGFGDF